MKDGGSSGRLSPTKLFNQTSAEYRTLNTSHSPGSKGQNMIKIAKNYDYVFKPFEDKAVRDKRIRDQAVREAKGVKGDP